MVGWPSLVGPFPDQSLRRGSGLVSAQPRKDNAQGHTAWCSQPPWSPSVLLLLALCWSRASAISSHAAWISSPITSTDLGSPPSISHPFSSPCHGASCLHTGVHRTAPPLVPLCVPLPHAPVLSSHCSHILVGRSPAAPMHGCLTPFLFFGTVQGQCCQRVFG